MSEDMYVPGGGPYGSYIVEEKLTVRTHEPYLVYEIKRFEPFLDANEQRSLLKALNRITKGRLKINIPPTPKQSEKNRRFLLDRMKKLENQ